MKETSIAYFLTNRILLEKIFFGWNEFNEKLQKGSNAVKKELYDLWNITKDKLEKNNGLKIIDLEKNPTVDNFDITSNITKNNIRIFYFIFPDADVAMAQCKCTALALTPNVPRYFTMEYSTKIIDKVSFVFGEWQMNFKPNEFVHKNYGKLTNPTINDFAKRIHEILESL